MLAAFRGRLRAHDARTERRLVLAGLALALHFAAWIASLRYASVAISTLLVCTTPVWTEAYAVARRRRLDPYAAISVTGALAGVAIVVGLPDRANTPLGIALALCGALAISTYLLIVRGTDARYDTLAVTARTYAYAAVALGIAVAATHDPFPPLADARAWGGILAMALISQLFGHTAMNSAVRVVSPTFVGTMTLLEPVIAALLAAAIFGERLGATTALGAAIILGAIAVALRGEGLTERTERVNDGRGEEQRMDTLPRLEQLRVDDLADGPIETDPGRFVDDDELLALNERLGPIGVERFADGTLLVSPPAGFESASRNAELTFQVRGWCKATRAGHVGDSSGGVHFPDTAMLAPDTTFVSHASWAAGVTDRAFPQLVPDAVFELLSKTDRPRIVMKKAETYVRCGVKLVVLIDPYRRRVHVARGGAGLRDLGEVASLDCSPEMPGFVLNVDDVIRARP